MDSCVKRSRAVIVLEYILLCKPYRYTAAVCHKMIVIAFCVQMSGTMQRVPCVDLSSVSAVSVVLPTQLLRRNVMHHKECVSWMPVR